MNSFPEVTDQIRNTLCDQRVGPAMVARVTVRLSNGRAASWYEIKCDGQVVTAEDLGSAYAAATRMNR